MKDTKWLAGDKYSLPVPLDSSNSVEKLCDEWVLSTSVCGIGSFSAHTATHSTSGSAHETQSFSTELRKTKNYQRTLVTSPLCIEKPIQLCYPILCGATKKRRKSKLLLSELEQGAKVLLLLTIDGKHFEFETIVQGKHKHDVLLEPIRKDQKILNVQSDQVDVDIMYMREDDKPILWKEAKMECIRHKHKIYYASEAANEGREYNRRGAYRLYIGEEIHARIGHSGREKIVHLKDLSNTGFAFIYKEELKDADGAFVYMTYMAQYEEKVTEIALFGKIVRTMPLDDGRFFVRMCSNEEK